MRKNIQSPSAPALEESEQTLDIVVVGEDADRIDGAPPEDGVQPPLPLEGVERIGAPRGGIGSVHPCLAPRLGIGQEHQPDVGQLGLAPVGHAERHDVVLVPGNPQGQLKIAVGQEVGDDKSRAPLLDGSSHVAQGLADVRPAVLGLEG